MQIALDVHVIDRHRGRVRLEDGRSLRVIAGGDHRGRSCATIVASHLIAIDDGGGAYAVDVAGMAATPLGRLVSSILGSEESAA